MSFRLPGAIRGSYLNFAPVAFAVTVTLATAFLLICDFRPAKADDTTVTPSLPNPFPIVIVTPSAAPSTPAPALHFAAPTFFVLSLTNDPALNSRIAVEVAGSVVQSNLLNPRYWITSAPPEWKLVDYEGQCAADPFTTAGAFIVYNATTQSGTYNYLLASRQIGRLNVDVMLAECTLAGATKVVWMGHDVYGADREWTATLLPIAEIFGAVAALQAPKTTTETDTTITYPTPPATTPIPEYTSSITTRVTANPTNPNSISGATLFVAGQLASAGAATLTVPSTASDPILKATVQIAARRMIHRLATSWPNVLAARRCTRCSDWFRDLRDAANHKNWLKNRPSTDSTAPTPENSPAKTKELSFMQPRSDLGSVKSALYETPDELGNFLAQDGGYETNAVRDGLVWKQVQVSYSVTTALHLTTITESIAHNRFDGTAAPLCTTENQASYAYTFDPRSVTAIGEPAEYKYYAGHGEPVEPPFFYWGVTLTSAPPGFRIVTSYVKATCPTQPVVNSSIAFPSITTSSHIKLFFDSESEAAVFWRSAQTAWICESKKRCASKK